MSNHSEELTAKLANGETVTAQTALGLARQVAEGAHTPEEWAALPLNERRARIQATFAILTERK